MKRLSRADVRVLFPWEGKGGLRRWIGLGRMRPFLLAFMVIGFVWVVGARERRATGLRTSRERLLEVRQGIDRFMAENDGGCPPSLSKVSEYMPREEVPPDAWGRPFRLICPSSRPGYDYELMSDGPDGEPGGLDRIE
ncbi:MAG TPA: type II secretion system protein GspG [Polyangiaceae bacterium]